MYPKFEIKEVKTKIYNNLNPKWNISLLNRSLIEDKSEDLPEYLFNNDYYCFKVNHLPVDKQAKNYYKNDLKLHPLLFNSRFLEFIPKH